MANAKVFAENGLTFAVAARMEPGSVVASPAVGKGARKTTALGHVRFNR